MYLWPVLRSSPSLLADRGTGKEGPPRTPRRGVPRRLVSTGVGTLWHRTCGRRGPLPRSILTPLLTQTTRGQANLCLKGGRKLREREVTWCYSSFSHTTLPLGVPYWKSGNWSRGKGEGRAIIRRRVRKRIWPVWGIFLGRRTSMTPYLFSWKYRRLEWPHGEGLRDFFEKERGGPVNRPTEESQDDQLSISRSVWYGNERGSA